MRVRVLAAIATLTALLTVGISTPASAEPPFYGLGKSKDGDSLMVGTREVQLFT